MSLINDFGTNLLKYKFVTEIERATKTMNYGVVWSPTAHSKTTLLTRINIQKTSNNLDHLKLSVKKI